MYIQLFVHPPMLKFVELHTLTQYRLINIAAYS